MANWRTAGSSRDKRHWQSDRDELDQKLRRLEHTFLDKSLGWTLGHVKTLIREFTKASTVLRSIFTTFYT